MNKAPRFLFTFRQKKGWRTMNEKEKKPNIFKRLKRGWKEDLTEDDRDIFQIAGIWCLDGALFGTLITGAVVGNKSKKMQKQALAAGYIQGQMDAYKEMAQNPYGMMDAGMRKLEMQGKAKKF